MTQEKMNWGILSTVAIAQEQMIPAILKAYNAVLLAIGSGKEVIEIIDIGNKVKVQLQLSSFI